MTEEVKGNAVQGELGAGARGDMEELALGDVLFFYVALGVVV